LIIKYIYLFLLPIVHYCITKNLEIMKTLNFEQMENVQGGEVTGKEFWDGVCAIWGMGRIARIFMFTTPATAALALSADIVCTAWAVSRVVG